MDYEVINNAIYDIVDIVNYHNRYKGYSISISENLVLALLGYYLLFGPDFFGKIDKLLRKLDIYECKDLVDINNKKIEVNGKNDGDYNPGCFCHYKYNGDGELIDILPKIFYIKDSIVRDPFVLIHEISHALETLNVEVLDNDDEIVKIKSGFREETIKKDANAWEEVNGLGITELVTMMVQNRAFIEFMKLDYSRIENEFVKEFLVEISKYNNKNVMSSGYAYLSCAFKDLCDNDSFLELIKKYYYENECDLLISEFNSVDEQLDFNMLITYAGKVYENFNQVIYYIPFIQKQLDIYSKKTNFESDKRLLLLV